MTISNDISFVGALQDFGQPFASLYADRHKRKLYVVLPLHPEVPESRDFAAFEVAGSEVEQYMRQEISMSELAEGKEIVGFYMEGSKMLLKNPISSILLQEAIEAVDRFEPDFCEDSYWIETFLKRIKKGKPLMAAC